MARFIVIVPLSRRIVARLAQLCGRSPCHLLIAVLNGGVEVARVLDGVRDFATAI